MFTPSVEDFFVQVRICSIHGLRTDDFISPLPPARTVVTNRGERHWMDFARAPDAEALIDFLTRLTQGSRVKLFLIHGNLRVHDGDALPLWLTEHEELIEIFCLPGHASSGAPAHLQPLALAA